MEMEGECWQNDEITLPVEDAFFKYKIMDLKEISQENRAQMVKG